LCFFLILSVQDNKNIDLSITKTTLLLTPIPKAFRTPEGDFKKTSSSLTTPKSPQGDFKNSCLYLKNETSSQIDY